MSDQLIGRKPELAVGDRFLERLTTGAAHLVIGASRESERPRPSPRAPASAGSRLTRQDDLVAVDLVEEERLDLPAPRDVSGVVHVDREERRARTLLVGSLVEETIDGQRLVPPSETPPPASCR